MVNISALKTGNHQAGVKIAQTTGVCAKGPISATVITPDKSTTKAGENPPLIAIHGISRNSEELVREFQSAAAAHQQVVIVPHFDSEHWPVFQRITGKHRPDLALLALINTLRQNGVVGDQPVNLFGYSGGAQLVHRFAMLFPELVNDLHLGAAGWYTLPMPNLPYPLGIGPGSPSGNWHLLMESSLTQFLQRRIQVYVGTDDITQDKSLRREPLLNQVQGDTRVERAERYVSLISHCQTELGLPTTANLTLLEGCGHDFTQCCQQGGLIDQIATSAK